MPLGCECGFAYAQVIDFTDLSTFDGRLVYVYDVNETLYINSEDIEKISSCSIQFGPGCLFDFPATRGKYAWKYLGETDNVITEEWPLFKDCQGSLLNKDWSQYGMWFIHGGPDKEVRSAYIDDYETVRRMETTILQTHHGIPIKITMMHLINKDRDVSECYDMTDATNRNMYVQIVNTYYSKERATDLLSIIKE